MVRLEGGTKISVPENAVGQAIFSALMGAGLLVTIPPKDETRWETWGVQVDVDGEERIEATLISEEAAIALRGW